MIFLLVSFNNLCHWSFTCLNIFLKAQHDAMGRTLLVECAESCKENQLVNQNNILRNIYIFIIRVTQDCYHIVCTSFPPPCFYWGGINLLPNFQKGGAWQDLNFERGVAGKQGSNFFQEGVAIFTKKLN